MSDERVGGLFQGDGGDTRQAEDLYHYVQFVEWRPGPLPAGQLVTEYSSYEPSEQPPSAEPVGDGLGSAAISDEAFGDGFREEAISGVTFAVRLSVYAIGSAALGLVLIAAFQGQAYFTGLGGLVLAATLHAASRFGLYRWAAANRARGLELTLSLLRKNDRSALERKMADAGWNNLLMAWRIVVPLIFREIYHRHFPRPFTLRREYAATAKYGSVWFVPPKVLGTFEGVRWESDSILRNLQALLHLLTGLSMVPPLFALYQIGGTGRDMTLTITCGAAALCLVGLLAYLIVGAVRYQRILERELMAAPTCGTLWIVATLAHLSAHRGVVRSRKKDLMPYRTYMDGMAHEMVGILKSLSHLEGWIGEKAERLSEDDATI